MEIGILSDEIALDFSEAVRYGTSWGVYLYEIRCTPSGRIPYISEAEVEEILRCKQDSDITITAITPGILKVPLKDKDSLKREIEQTLPASFRMAERLGTNKVIVFGFRHYNGEPDSNFRQVIDILGRVAMMAEKEGFLIALENEPGFWADTGVNTAKILSAVGSKHLKANWDPGNAVGTGEAPYPEGYSALKPYICNVHAKDSPANSLVECVPIGEGMVDWQGQLRALVQDDLVSHITIETHCLPVVEKSRQNVETVRKMLNEILAL